MFKKIMDKWNSINLVIKIACGLVLGILLSLLTIYANVNMSFLGVLGDIFVGALKGIAPVLVFILIMSAIGNANGKIGKRFGVVIALYMVTTLLAAIIAVVACFIFPVSVTLEGVEAAEGTATNSLGEVFKTLLMNLVQNPISAIIGGNYLGILFWSIIAGILMRKFSSDATKSVVKDLANIVSEAVRFIVGFAPFGILGIVYSTVTAQGFTVFLDYGKLLLVIVGCMLVTSLIVNPAIIFGLLKRNPYPLVFRCMKSSAITAFFTRSSAANIPVNMQLCKELGLDEDFYSVSIPLGATINMDGAAVTIAVMALVAANSLGVEVTFLHALLLSVVATFAACGASGVAGGSLLLIPLACSLFGISNDVAMQMVAIGFIIGVIQDSVETALNSSGDAIFTATAEFMEWKKEGKEIKF